MPNGEQIKIAQNEESFRLYVVENLGGVRADVNTLKEQNTEQFQRLRKIETGDSPICKQHAKGIEELKKRSRRPIVAGSVSGAVGGISLLEIGRWFFSLIRNGG